MQYDIGNNRHVGKVMQRRSVSVNVLVIAARLPATRQSPAPSTPTRSLHQGTYPLFLSRSRSLAHPRSHGPSRMKRTRSRVEILPGPSRTRPVASYGLDARLVTCSDAATHSTAAAKGPAPDSIGLHHASRQIRWALRDSLHPRFPRLRLSGLVGPKHTRPAS